jgi:hypothetical protein
MSISRAAGLALVAFTACHRYNYREPSCPPVAPTHPIRLVQSSEIRGSVFGVVSSQATGEALGLALVSLLPRGALDTSDVAGAFRFDSVGAGRYMLLTRRLGYEGRRDTMSVPEGAGVRLEVTLDAEPVDGCPGFMMLRVPRPWWRWLW